MLHGIVSSQISHSAIQRGFKHLDQAAEQIVEAALPTGTEAKPTDLIKPVVELNEAEIESKAALRLFDAEREQVGSLLDVVA